MTKITEMILGTCSLSSLLSKGLNKRKQKKERTKGIITSLDIFSTAKTAKVMRTPRKICTYLKLVEGVSVMKQL